MKTCESPFEEGSSLRGRGGGVGFVVDLDLATALLIGGADLDLCLSRKALLIFVRAALSSANFSHAHPGEKGGLQPL